jgi:hypothetical protein
MYQQGMKNNQKDQLHHLSFSLQDTDHRRKHLIEIVLLLGIVYTPSRQTIFPSWTILAQQHRYFCCVFPSWIRFKVEGIVFSLAAQPCPIAITT